MSSSPRPPALDAGYLLVPEPPSVDEYVALRAAAGLSAISPAQAAPAVRASWAWTVVRTEDGSLAAMGRVIGDGGWYFHIADMATQPAHQRRGLGRCVLEDLLGRIRAAAPPDPYITLMADPPGRRLYDAVGFVDAAPTLGMRWDGR